MIYQIIYKIRYYMYIYIYIWELIIYKTYINEYNIIYDNIIYNI